MTDLNLFHPSVEVKFPPRILREYSTSERALRLDSRSKTTPHRSELIDAEKGRHVAKPHYSGWSRPDTFTSTFTEVLCVLSICMSHMLVEYFNLGFVLMVPSILKLESDMDSIWPVVAYHISLSVFTLPLGRMQDRIGSHFCFIFGLIWLGICSLLAGTAKSFWLLCMWRSLSGIGPSAFLAAGVKSLESLYPSSPRKHLVSYLYAISASIGVFAGLLAAGLTTTYNIPTEWYFWMGAIWCLVTSLISLIWVSQCSARDVTGKCKSQNWAACLCLILGLGLTLSAIAQGAYADRGWKTPLVLELVGSGIVFLAVTAYVESSSAQPLLPTQMFMVPKMNVLITVILLDSGFLGVCLAFGGRLIKQTSTVTTLHLVLWYLPVYVVSPAMSVFTFWVRHGPRTGVLIWAQFSWMVAIALVVVSTQGATYWTFAFTSMIFASMASSATFDTAGALIYEALGEEGLASTLINFLKYLGMALFLSMGDNMRSTFQKRSMTSTDSIKMLFWLTLVPAIVALVASIVWVRIDDKIGSTGPLVDLSSRRQSDVSATQNYRLRTEVV